MNNKIDDKFWKKTDLCKIVGLNRDSKNNNGNNDVDSSHLYSNMDNKNVNNDADSRYVYNDAGNRHVQNMDY